MNHDTPPFFIKGKKKKKIAVSIFGRVLMRLNISSPILSSDDARSSVYIVDDDCSTLSHQTTNSNESQYLNPKRAKRYDSIRFENESDDNNDVTEVQATSRRRMSSKIRVIIIFVK